MKMKNFIIGIIFTGMWLSPISAFAYDRQYGSIEITQIAKIKKLTGITNLGSVGTADINGGTIDGATVGASSASTGAFTTLDASGATTLSGALAVDAAMHFGTDTLTTDAAEPGTATATLAKVTTYVISDATGDGQDVITLIDGTLEGQVKEFILLTDAETSGVAIAPTSVTMVGGAGTSTLMEDAGDSVQYKWNSALGWTLISNIGATIQ